MASLCSAGAAGAAGTEGFFAWLVCERLVRAELGAARVVVVGRVVVVLADEDREARGEALAAEPSTDGRVVRGRFAAAAVAEGVGLVAVVRPGEDLVAAVDVNVVRRAAGFLFSSPDVMADRSGSASEAADLETNGALRTVVPGAGRVGGLFKLDPAAAVRADEAIGALDAVVEARAAVVDDAAGRRAAAAAPAVVAGRRGGTASLGVDEAILRRAGDAGVVGGRGLLWSGAVVARSGGASPGTSLAAARSSAMAAARRAAPTAHARGGSTAATELPVAVE